MKAGKRIIIAAVMVAITMLGSSMQAKATGKFDPVYYANRYEDVKAVYGTDAAALYNHYLNNGRNERRVPFNGALAGEQVDGIVSADGTAKFNPVFYADKYPDIKAVFGTDAQALYNHYLNNGRDEGRIPYPGAPAGAAVKSIATAEEMAQQSEHKPVTYVLRYVDDDKEWRFQSGQSTWKSDGFHRELYYMQLDIQDGDIVVVDGSGFDSGYDLNVTLSANLGNVTFTGGAGGVINAKSIKDVYVLQNTTGIINGNVTNAYVYDNGVANFNNDVTNLHIKNVNSNKQTIGVLGKVDYAEWSDTQNIRKQLYSFTKGTFYQERGSLKTNELYYYR